MAVDRALITKLRVLGAAIETTTGTAASLSGTTAAFNVMDMLVNADIPANERQGQGSLSPLIPTSNARMGKVTFKHEVVGSGSSSDPAWMAVFLAACGFVGSSGTYSPKSGASATATIGGYVDGRLFTVLGAMGKVTFDAEAGKPMVGSYEFNGVWTDPSATALVTPTYPTVIPPRFAAATLTIGGTTYRIPKVSIIIENTLVMRQDGAGTAAGYHACGIFGRKISVKLNPEALPLGTQDWYAGHLAGTTYALSLVLGGTTHNITTFAAPNLVLINPPQYEDDNGIYRDSLEFLATAGSSAGDDELTIAAS